MRVKRKVKESLQIKVLDPGNCKICFRERLNIRFQFERLNLYSIMLIWAGITQVLSNSK